MDVINLSEYQAIECAGELIKLTIGEYTDYWVLDSITVTTRSGEICTMDEAYEIHGDYYHESEFDDFNIVYDAHNECYELKSNCYHGFINRREEGYFGTDADYVCLDDTYYMDDLVAASHGVSHCSDCDSHYYGDNGCNCSNNRYCFEYHEKSYKDFSSDSPIKIGFEVEKEDYEVIALNHPDDLYHATGWAKTSDSSLNDESGFELVSPILPLTLDVAVYQQEPVVHSFEQVKLYLNAEYSNSCGGHINISMVGYDSGKLLNHISGYIPLFYAIYQSRIQNPYSKAHPLKSYLNGVANRAAFHCRHSGVLEIRLIPAVRSTKNLLWRTELIRLILKNSTSSYKQALHNLVNPNAELHKHLRLVFTQLQMLQKVKLFAKYAKQFEQVELSPKVINRSIIKVLKVA